MKINRKNIIYGVLIIIVGIQFIRIDKTNPPADPGSDFINIAGPPEEVANLLRQACYDCHSHHTEYPWYSNIAPFSWIIANDVSHAREHVNFSLWSDYDQEKKDDHLGEMAEEVEEKGMPLNKYIFMHPEADLTDEQRQTIVSWIENYRSSL